MQGVKYLSIIIITLITLTCSNVSAQDEDMFFEPKSTLGGYGELHYNHVEPEEGEITQTLDFHRFVLFYGYNWNEKWSFKSEVELEHNFVKDGQGELELEQAYVNYHHADWFGFQVGVILPSAGLINEYHEPPLFLSVERPDYHKNIIPTTWFGNGAAVYGSYRGFSYKAVVMEGLNSDKFSASSGIRSGRRKGFKSDARNLLYNLRLDYTNIPGLKFGGSITYNKANGEETENKIVLVEGHAQYNNYGVYSVFEIGNIAYETGDFEQSIGYYFDLGYNVGRLLKSDIKIIPFFRWTQYNTAATSPFGRDFEDQHETQKWMVGLSIKPIDSVVFKVDFSEKTVGADDVKTTLFNLGAGYMF